MMKTTSTLLPVATSVTFPAFRALATAWELPAEPRDTALVLPVEGGAIEVLAEGGATRLCIAAEAGATLQMLRDLLTDQIAQYGLTPVWEGERSARRPANLSLARVARVERLSPSYTRVTIEGADLARFAIGGMHFRLLFGPEGEGWPETDDNGVTQWPGGAAAWHRPVYTTRQITCNGAAARLSFDVFRHAGGRVSDWTETLAPGTEVALTGPGGDARVSDAPWQALIGDETALPVIARKLALLPAETTGAAVLLVPHRADIQQLSHPEGMVLNWLIRSEGAQLLDALSNLALPDVCRRHVFFAAEKAEVEVARLTLAERGLGKKEIMAATYWQR